MLTSHWPYRLIHILAFAMLPILSYGQTTLGVYAGTNFSDHHFETPSNSSLQGYAVGIQGGSRISPKFRFESVLQYARKGWKFVSFIPPEMGGEMHLDYIDLQLLGNYEIVKRLSVLGGVELGRLIKTRREPYVSIFDDYYQKNNFSLVGGVSIRPLKPLQISFKYSYGLSYLAKFTTTDINGNSIGVFKDGHLSVIQLGIAVDIINYRRKSEPAIPGDQG